MALFQQSVLKKHLNDLNKEQLQQAWSRFTTHFHDPAKQQNIRNARTNQLQQLIDATDKEIDRMVYELTEEEIKIVEG